MDESLALGPSLLVPKPEPVLAFVPAFDVRSGSSSNPNPNPKPSMDPRVLDVVSGDDGARAGEWHVFDNGVAFVPDHGCRFTSFWALTSRRLTFTTRWWTRTASRMQRWARRRLRLAPCALAPSHLFLHDDDDAGTSRLNGTTSVAFSLAPLGDKSKRHFARVVVPRWRRVCASGHRQRGGRSRRVRSVLRVRGRTGLGAYAAATPSQAWACGRARSTRSARAGSRSRPSASSEASVAHSGSRPGAGLGGARRGERLDAELTPGRVNTYLHAASSSERDRRRGRLDGRRRRRHPARGAADGCQDDVFDALRRDASGSATWLATEAVAPCAAAESVRELAHALASVRAVAARSDGGAARKPYRVCVTARTYESAAEVAASVTEATTLAAELLLVQTPPPTDRVRMRLGAVTACVAADGFFADAERRPAFGALAQVTPPACDNVVCFHGARRGGGVVVLVGSRRRPRADFAGSRGRRRVDPRAIRARGGDVNVTVGARRLLSSPLAAATTTKKSRRLTTR